LPAQISKTIATRSLYRPVGWYELKLIQASDYTTFPPRLPHQPIFYPVLNFEYAEQIAQQWNTKDAASGYMGAVTRFELPVEYLAQFEEQLVGDAAHRELWIPAEELNSFNQQLTGRIEVVSVYYGDQFTGEKAW
jgi:hypothetical protein